jgi:SAM-dependent methyltransferase
MNSNPGLQGSMRWAKRLIKESPLAGLARVMRDGWLRITYLFATPQDRRHSLSGPVGHPGIWKLKRDYQISFLKQRMLRPNHYLLELGCGTLRGGLPIIDFLHEGHYYGIDARGIALEEARKELAESNLEHKRPTLILESDFSRVRLDRTFDFIWAFSVLPHLDDEILRGAFRCAKRHLGVDGQVLATAAIGSRRQGRWMEFPDLVRPLEFYAREAAKEGLNVQDLGVLSSLGHPPDVVNWHHHMLLFTAS